MLRYAAKVRKSLVSHSCPILSPFCDFKGVVVTPITPHPFSRLATESRKYGTWFNFLNCFSAKFYIIIKLLLLNGPN